MKWVSSKLQNGVSRLVTNLESDAWYNETQETSEPVFLLVFLLAVGMAVLSFYVVSPIRRWFFNGG